MLLGILAAATTILPATLDGPLVPAGQWIVEKNETSCRASRAFGKKADTKLTIFALPLTGKYNLSFTLRHPIAISYGEPVRLIVKPTERQEVSSANGFMQSRGSQRTFGMLADEDIFSDDLDVVQIAVRNRIAVDLAMTDVGQMRNALNSCVHERLREFGIDSSELESVAVPPRPLVGDLASWIQPDDYPVEALRAGAQGRVAVRFRVLENGTVDHCRVVISSGNAALDERTCAVLLMRARYTPARSRSGAPTSATQLFFTRWMMPLN